MKFAYVYIYIIYIYKFKKKESDFLAIILFKCRGKLDMKHFIDY